MKSVLILVSLLFGINVSEANWKTLKHQPGIESLEYYTSNPDRLYRSIYKKISGINEKRGVTGCDMDDVFAMRDEALREYAKEMTARFGAQNIYNMSWTELSSYRTSGKRGWPDNNRWCRVRAYTRMFAVIKLKPPSIYDAISDIPTRLDDIYNRSTVDKKIFNKEAGASCTGRTWGCPTCSITCSVGQAAICRQGRTDINWNCLNPPSCYCQ